jgi:hypothetical protein
MFELFASFANNFCAEAICPNFELSGYLGKSTKSNSFQQDHLKPQAQDINFFATYIVHSKWRQSRYVHDRFAVRLPPCAALA